MKEIGKKPQKKEDRLKVFGTKAGLLLCVAAIGLNLFVWPIIATESTVPSITATTLDPNTLQTSTTTSPLNTITVGGHHTYFQSPTEPCGPPKKPDQKVSPFNTDLRKLLCIKISHIAKIFGTELSRKDIEQIARRTVIVSKTSAEELCGPLMEGCYDKRIDMTILARFSQPPLESVMLHEWLHRTSTHLIGSHYLSEKTGICYRRNSNGNFFMTYLNPDGTASKLNIPDEMAPIIFEQLLYSQQGSKTNPPYLTIGKEIDWPLNAAFSRLGENYLADPSKFDLKRVLSNKPITMEDFFKPLEQLIGDQAAIVFLTERLSKHLPTTATDNRFAYIPAEASKVSPAEACGK